MLHIGQVRELTKFCYGSFCVLRVFILDASYAAYSALVLCECPQEDDLANKMSVDCYPDWDFDWWLVTRATQ